MPKGIPKNVERYVQEGKDKGLPEDEAWAVAWSRYCLTGEAVIPTSGGMMSVGDIFYSAGAVLEANGGVVVKRAELTTTSTHGEGLITHVMNMGVKPVVRVSTAGGFEVRCTHDHRLLTLDKKTLGFVWKPAGDLTKGDIAVLQSSGVWGSRESIPRFRYASRVHNNVIPLKTPTKLTRELSRVLGYLVAEGSVTEEGVEFSNTNPRIVDDFVRCITDSFGIDPHVVWTSGGRHGRPAHWKPSCKVRMRTRWFSEFFSHVGMPPGRAEDKKIPGIVLSAPKHLVTEFIKAYVEGDGYTGGKGHTNRVDFSTVSPGLAKQFQLVMANLGIPTTRRPYPKRKGRVYWVTQVSGYENVSKYVCEVGTIFKKVLVTDGSRTQGTKFRSVPVGTIREAGRRAKSAGGIKTVYHPACKTVSIRYTRDKWEHFEKMRRTDSVLVRNIEEIIRTGASFDSVREVVQDGEEKVYDVTVRGTHSFASNGLISHNCKYKFPDSPRCKQKDYFTGRKAMSLRSRLIRTAHANPAAARVLLPILAASEGDDGDGAESGKPLDYGESYKLAKEAAKGLLKSQVGKTLANRVSHAAGVAREDILNNLSGQGVEGDRMGLFDGAGAAVEEFIKEFGNGSSGGGRY